MTQVLGIDPGSRLTGYGIIEVNGNHTTHIDHGCIRVKGTALADRLRQIFDGVSTIIDRYQPEEVAVERVFMHKNADSALKLGQARGVAIAAAAVGERQVFEYTANQVKQAVVGRGHAEKGQIQRMIQILLCLNETLQADAADALGVALCHSHARDHQQRITRALSQ